MFKVRATPRTAQKWAVRVRRNPRDLILIVQIASRIVTRTKREIDEQQSSNSKPCTDHLRPPAAVCRHLFKTKLPRTGSKKYRQYRVSEKPGGGRSLVRL